MTADTAFQLFSWALKKKKVMKTAFQLVQQQRTEVWPLLEDSNEDASIIIGNSVGITVKTATKKAMQSCFDVYFSLKEEHVGNTYSFV